MRNLRKANRAFVCDLQLAGRVGKLDSSVTKMVMGQEWGQGSARNIDQTGEVGPSLG